MPPHLSTPPPLAPDRKAALRKYYSSLEPEAVSCRVTGRHWFPDIAAYGKDPNVDIEPVSGQQGAWQVATHCHRCGVPMLYTIDKSSGHVERRGRIDYTRLDNYLWAYGDGPMTAQDRDFLRSLQLEEGIALKRSLDAKKRATRKAKTKEQSLVMDTAPETAPEVHFSAAAADKPS